MTRALKIARALERGVGFHRSGRLSEAAGAYREVLELDRGNFDALNLLGLVEHAQGRFTEALACFERAVASGPRTAAAHFNKANTLGALGRGADAVGAYRKALALQPDYADAWLNLGASLHQQGDLAGAIAAFKEMTNKHPRDVRGHYNVGRCLAQDAQPELAEAALSEALRLAPTSTDALITLAKLYADTQRTPHAITTIQKALALDPKNATALMNLGTYLSHIDDHGGAENAYAQALASDPESLSAKVNLAMVQFTQGKLKQAWDNYAVRAHSTGSFVFRRLELPWPTWAGEPLAGKRIFVWGEQGLGDEILFSSIIPEIAAEAGACTFGCSEKLVTLFQRSFPNVEVTALDKIMVSVPDRQFDFQTSIIDLGRWRRRTFSAFPNRSSFLICDPAKLRVARGVWGTLKSSNEKLIGFSWRSFAPHVGEQKTPPLHFWENQLQIENTKLVNLQYGPRAEVEAERAHLSNLLGRPIHNVPEIDLTTDIEMVAAQICAMDQVVTVSNTVAHLAAALGVPSAVVVPNGKARLWYWFKEGPLSPWYPSARLIRWHQSSEA